MLANGQTITQFVEELCPKHLAEPDDKIGLQVGSLQRPIRKVMVALDVTLEVVEEAISEGVDLIVAHHAVIYRPLPNIQTETPTGKLFERLIKHDIAVYIAHTNLDSADGGMNDWMADAIGIQAAGRSPITESHTEQLRKLVVFVPSTHQERVLEALFQAGAGWIGDYSHCSFNIQGTGTFMPREGTDPFIGTQGKLEKVEEVRIETIVPASIQRRVIQAMLKAHPYEEVAYDIYPMDLKGRTFGLGRVGKLVEGITLAQFVEQVKSALGVPAVRVVGSLDTPLTKAAVMGGSGGRFWRSAKFAGADVYVTGDIDYHTAQDALAAGLCLIDPGHHAEQIMKPRLAEYLTNKLASKKYTTQVIASSIHTEPFQFM